MNLDSLDFRNCMGRFATGVTVVTTKLNNDLPCGMTVNSFTSLSLEPPLVLFNVDKNAHNHDNFANCTKFTVNILSERQSDISQKFACPSTIKWQDIDYTDYSNNTPKINGCIAYIACDTEQIYKGGDHSIIIGRVTDMDIESKENPLIYFKGKYSKIGDKL
ncbi:MAG: flavin reductase family protein [Rickettsiales bacterium]|nr:flavin reductase family protein [Pseudomonadota bacterium]MDA0967453.1 flavin reductase family protein [Pseudomonadota bacterium]MDG4544179.1 flavin reductase family protein [Rickettsiales bacterium]MDG4546360.1 flavin reductase family protein [Rickettsiales bacterium]MDG4548503.1 flavin reductase family protein [Rickettsiales bacterium]